MLSFSAQSDFEAWLRRCPLDSRTLTYRVERKGGSEALTVGLSWEVCAPPSSAPLPASEVALASSAPASGTPPRAVSDLSDEGDSNQREIADTRARLAQMQAAISAASTGPFAAALMKRIEHGGGDDSGPPSPDGGGAAVAAMLLHRYKEQASADAGAAGPDTSAEAVRATLSQLGVVLPQPPGRPLAPPQRAAPEGGGL